MEFELRLEMVLSALIDQKCSTSTSSEILLCNLVGDTCPRLPGDAHGKCIQRNEARHTAGAGGLPTTAEASSRGRHAAVPHLLLAAHAHLRQRESQETGECDITGRCAYVTDDGIPIEIRILV